MMIESVRGFRPRQKGVECGVAGCTDWCVSNDLCAKHQMRARRKTVEGRAYTKEYNKRYRRSGLNKVCEHCKGGFVTARKAQRLCGECSKKYSASYSQKRRRRF